MDQARGIVTPEAVVLEFETAGVASRAAATLLDLFVQLLALGVISVAASALATAFGAGETVAVVLSLLLGLGVMVGYPTLMEAFWDGRTLFKSVFGLRVVTREGAPVRFRHTAIRAIARLFEVVALLGIPAVISATLTRDDQRIGDLLAGTIVLRDRTADPLATSVTFPPPPGYEQYVASLDVSGLTPEQYGVIRSFLLRARDLTPEARGVLAVRLANPVALRMHHAPPPAVVPELFLASVAAAYQQRQGREGRPPPSP